MIIAYEDQSPTIPTDGRTDGQTDNVTAPEPACMNDKQVEACWLPIASSSSSFALVNMRVVVQAEASFIAAVFRFKSLISLSTRPL